MRSVNRTSSVTRSSAPT